MLFPQNCLQIDVFGNYNLYNLLMSQTYFDEMH